MGGNVGAKLGRATVVVGVAMRAGEGRGSRRDRKVEVAAEKENRTIATGLLGVGAERRAHSRATRHLRESKRAVGTQRSPTAGGPPHSRRRWQSPKRARPARRPSPGRGSRRSRLFFFKQKTAYEM